MFAACVLAAVLSTSAVKDAGAVDAEITKILSALPGETAFAFTQIEDGKPRVLFGVHADQRLAVGSTFKLFILGTLIDEVNLGRRRADNTMLLNPQLVGPPTSELGSWPAGSPITLHTLALKMISISDNTATDHLHYLLGRERIEAQMAVMGHGDPAVNIPLLSTREMTMLRDKAQHMPANAYAKLDVAGKRKFLTTLDQGVADYDKLDFDTGAYKLSEWYASPIDMAHALTWIYENTQPPRAGAELRNILTVEDKLPHDAKIWPFVGFKGGSEDQILAGNWLMQNANGRWYTLHVYWNNPHGAADPQQFLKALAAILNQVQEAIQ